MIKARNNARTMTMQTRCSAVELEEHEEVLEVQDAVDDARRTGDSGLHRTTRALAKQ